MNIKFLSFGIFFLAINSLADDEVEALSNADEKITMEADELYYDKGADIAYAKGNVILNHEGRIISAQHLTYDRNTEEVFVYDDVIMQEKDGNVYFSDQAKINLKSDNAIAVNFKGQMGLNTKVAAKGAFMDDKNHMHLESFVYSPCKICQQNLRSNFPLWEIRADSAELDKEKERIYYKNAYLEAFGVPFIYTPYFSTPAPGAKRKSGILTPKIKFSNVYGASLQLPLYWNIAPNMDLTYRPTIMQKKGVFNNFEFRHKIKQGEYTFKTSFITSDPVNKKGESQSGAELRGHYDLDGKFNVHDKGYFNVKSRYLYDKPKSYLKKYKITDDDVLTTDLNYRYINENNFHSARSLLFQGLRPSDDHKTTLNALPIFDGYFEKKIPQFFSSKIHTSYNIAHLFREQGSSYEKTSVRPAITTPFNMPYGQLLNIETSVRADAYRIKHKPILLQPNDKFYTDNEIRIYPEIYSEWSWPFINFIQNEPIILEPVIGLAIAPTIKKNPKLDSDSQSPEISANNLFSKNRFSGYDKIEDGNRVNYGLRGNLKSLYFRNLSFLVGQVIRQKKNEEFDYSGGLKDKVSNVVSKLSLQLNKHLSLSHRARYDQKTLSPLRNEFNLDWQKEKYNFSAIYSGVNKNIITQQDQKFRQEILLHAGYNFYGPMWIKGFTHMGLKKRLKVEKKTLVEEGIILEYKGDCLIVEVGARRNHLSIGDARSSTNYSFSFIIPTF